MFDPNFMKKKVQNAPTHDIWEQRHWEEVEFTELQYQEFKYNSLCILGSEVFFHQNAFIKYYEIYIKTTTKGLKFSNIKAF